MNEESAGRAVLGIGRGDSALAHIGLAPATVTSFVHYLERVQGRGRDAAVHAREQRLGRVARREARNKEVDGH